MLRHVSCTAHLQKTMGRTPTDDWREKKRRERKDAGSRKWKADFIVDGRR